MEQQHEANMLLCRAQNKSEILWRYKKLVVLIDRRTREITCDKKRARHAYLHVYKLIFQSITFPASRQFNKIRLFTHQKFLLIFFLIYNRVKL